ncbi:uncharacterized protein LOC129737744 [Uranotaenia lowii]|uniref:uncharacterized protein LOC129737744 n=1 Tax=Uranotaenia lowii TaxID=190385 RepID=UPI00247AACA1|nr:uncharacterized protein LOC129737744 [Uranotaenia lowii]
MKNGPLLIPPQIQRLVYLRPDLQRQLPVGWRGKSATRLASGSQLTKKCLYARLFLTSEFIEGKAWPTIVRKASSVLISSLFEWRARFYRFRHDDVNLTKFPDVFLACLKPCVHDSNGGIANDALTVGQFLDEGPEKNRKKMSRELESKLQEQKSKLKEEMRDKEERLRMV